MLDLSRMESAGSDLARRREFDISETVISTLLSFEARAADKQLDVDLQVPEQHINVIGDPDAITRVVYNLMDNAVKFAPRCATVGIDICATAQSYIVSVSNTGSDIPIEKQKRIFNKFYQADESHAQEGSGIGLAIVKKIVELHNGWVSVKSDNGMTVFSVELPRQQV
jgi:signal transduction histidine kinase